MDMGFEKAGFEVVWTNEMNPDFVKLYEAGMTQWRRATDPSAKTATITAPVSLMDAGEPHEILKQAFPGNVPRFFGMIGGPPCQDFSIAGLRAGFAGTRGSVTHEYCLYVRYMKPAFFVMENVRGLLLANHKKGFEDLRGFLEEDYVTDYKVLNSLDYGVPQNRERLFLVGIRRDLIKDSISKSSLQNGWINWTIEQTHAGLKDLCKWPTAEKLGAEPEVPVDAGQLALSVFNCLVPKGEEAFVPNARDRFRLYSEKPANTPEGMVSTRCFKRLHRYRYSPTACYGHNEVHLHPWLDQRLSVREVLRIQGVDDSYIIPEGPSLSAKFKMIGNGVPVPLAYGVARTVKRLIEEYCHTPIRTSGSHRQTPNFPAREPKVIPQLTFLF